MSAAQNYMSVIAATSARLTTGDNSRTAPTTSSVVFDPGANGGMCERLTVTPVATTVASVVRFFLYDGTNYALLFEVPLAAQTVTAGGVVSSNTYSAVTNPELFPRMVPPGSKIKATVNDTQTGLQVTGEGGGA